MTSMSTKNSMAKAGSSGLRQETQSVVSLESFTSILDVEIDVYAERRSIAFGELMSLHIDSLPLRRSAGEDIDLYIGQTWSASGEILVLEGRLAVRVADLRDKPSLSASAPSDESE